MKTLLFRNEADLELIIGEGKTFRLFYDNAKLPDGNALFPREPVPIEGHERLVKDRRAAFIPVKYGNSKEIAPCLGLATAERFARRRGDWEGFKKAVNRWVGLWAHFGTYGAEDEVWVIGGWVTGGEQYTYLRREGAPTPGEEYRMLRREQAESTGPERQGQGSAKKKYRDKDFPIFKCFVTAEDQVKFWCPFCHKWHFHGGGQDWKGHRVAHCRDETSPLKDAGYVLRAYTKAELREIAKIAGSG